MPSIPSNELMDLILRTVKQVMRGRHGEIPQSGQRGNAKAVRSHWAILNGDLTAAQDGATDPSEAQIELLQFKNTTDDPLQLERSGVIETLTHRYEGIEVAKDTLVRVKVADDEWMLEATDCSPLSEPPP